MVNAPHRTWRIAHAESSRAWGGQEQRIWAELTGFKRRGSQVWLLAPANSEIFLRANAAALPSHPLNLAKWQFPGVVIGLARWLRQHRIEVLNPHSSRDSWLVGMAGRLAGTPYIVRTRHFDIPIHNLWLSRQAYTRLCDHLLTTSPKITANLQALFQLQPNQVSTIPTGIDLERFHPQGPKAELGPSTPNARRPKIGVIAIIRSAKGHAVLLEAARLLRAGGLDADYYFVGDGPSRGPLDQKIREWELEDCVTFTGFRNDIPEVLRALDLLVIPSLHEGIPQVGLQALAAKTPVVGSDVGGIPTIIRPGETGRLTPPGNAPALAQAIRDVFSNPGKTRLFAEQGRRLIEANHSLDRMLDQLEEVYRQAPSLCRE